MSERQKSYFTVKYLIMDFIIKKWYSELIFDSEKWQVKELLREWSKIFHSFSSVWKGEWWNSHITIFPIAGKKDIIWDNLNYDDID